MRNACSGWVIFCALAATLGCRAPSPDWNGTWKLNPSKSNFQGPILTISISVDGEYRYDDGNASFVFRCDGKDRPIPKNRTLACVKSSATVLDLTQKEDGVKTNAYHWELSADGKVLTATATEFRPSGPVVKGRAVTSRLSGSNDFAGQWQDTSYLQRHADMTLRLDVRPCISATIRNKCSVRGVFEALRLQIENDIKIRNDQLRSDNKRKYSYGMTVIASGIVVYLEGVIGTGQSIALSIAQNGSILVRDENNEPMLEAYPTISDDGKCRLQINGQERELWQVRKMILEKLFFHTY
jgi:hypothetical protein